MPVFSVESSLSADHAQLAQDLFTMQGVNAELSPIVRMTAPAAWAGRSIAEWPTREVLFTSTILLFGLLPIDRHRFMLESIQPHAFQETSSSLVNRAWNHQRTIQQDDTYCVVRDVVEYVPRVALLGALMAPIYAAIFRHRHRRLKAKYGAAVQKTS